VGEGAWIPDRLSPFGHMVTSVVPAGFEAYVRVLHPAQEPKRDGMRLVRWAEVAAWSGMPLHRDAQFHSIALPPVRPEAEAPWRSQGPEEGNLYLPDAEAIAGLAREWTTTPHRCWFCVWNGYGWQGTQFASPGELGLTLPDPVPAAIRNGPLVRLPHRDYLLYVGPAEAVTAVAPLSGSDQTPNLWWPADRAWCVATEIDLPWTYVGGPGGLINSILADERIEAVPAEPDDSLTHVEQWVVNWVTAATSELLANGETVISTSGGTVKAWLDRPTRLRDGRLRTASLAGNRTSGTGWVRLSRRGPAELADEISSYLTRNVTSLVDG